MDIRTLQILDTLSDQFRAQVEDWFEVPSATTDLRSGEMPGGPSTYHAVIPLGSSTLRGELLIVADHAFLHESYPDRGLGERLSQLKDPDWVGEIANRTLASSNPQISGLGLHFSLEMPRAKSGPPDTQSTHAIDVRRAISSGSIQVAIELRLEQNPFILQRVI